MTNHIPLVCARYFEQPVFYHHDGQYHLVGIAVKPSMIVTDRNGHGRRTPSTQLGTFLGRRSILPCHQRETTARGTMCGHRLTNSTTFNSGEGKEDASFLDHHEYLVTFLSATVLGSTDMSKIKNKQRRKTSHLDNFTDLIVLRP